MSVAGGTKDIWGLLVRTRGPFSYRRVRCPTTGDLYCGVISKAVFPAGVHPV